MNFVDSTGAVLVAIWGKGALWLVLAFGIAFLLRNSSAGQKRVFWIGTVLALVVLAGLQISSPKLHVPVFNLDLSEHVSTGSEPDVRQAEPEVTTRNAASPRASTDSAAANSPSAPAIFFRSLSFFQIAFLIWLAGMLLLALLFGKARLRLAHIWRRAEEIDSAWASELKNLATAMRLHRGDRVRIRQSPAVTTPLVWGIFRPKILIPISQANAPAASHKARRLVLLHELSHVANRDLSVNLAAQIALLIHWPNPLAWIALRQLRVVQERACDDLVLTASSSGRSTNEDYAELLLSLAQSQKFSRIESAVALSTVNHPSALKERITSIVNMKTKRHHPGKIESAAALIPQLLIAGTLAAIVFGESISAQEKRETEELKKKIAELEKTVEKLKEEAAPAIDKAKLEKIVAENRDKARQRMREDRNVYDQDELREIESLYQVANKKWRTEEGKESLEKLVKKYKKANRTGCALLYLGQMSEGDERETYLRKAVDDFSDCYYGDGCQVGGYARYLLAAYLIDKGKRDEADKLIKELERKYDTATSHSGKLIVGYLAKLKA